MTTTERVRLPWRGALTLASWVVWPVVFFNVYFFINVMLATGRRCSIEGCDFPEGVLGWFWLAVMWGPPFYFTVRWVQWRRARRQRQDAR